ncbi:siderophore synthetase component [Melghirimyces profundicolus]|uniref:Siderophore synthetase component n=1 Tax=Melghirimyces profundicolus TaxID=1242148 RepID=A0A2T6C8T5_9BACL|nr:IucA/IucC family protein [Melghirimyces profundicolus]PTX64686.1 siderophore synthetase component [Melghirimyces profundicolus]
MTLKRTDTEEMEITWRALRSEEAAGVRRRLIRQLVETLLYEGVLSSSEVEREGEKRFEWEGRDRTGKPVHYWCRGERRFSFDRIRLVSPLYREGREAVSLSRFLEEIGEVCGADGEQLNHFTRELEETLVKDTLCQYLRRREGRTLLGKGYDELEGELMDGHPYHPSYKSRIGFSLSDHLAYGPEFLPEIRPVWLAVRREEARLAVSESISPPKQVEALAGTAVKRRLREAAKDAGADPVEYLPIPVHPWQWRNVIAVHYQRALETGEILFLGPSEDGYRPQQSIRTLANVTCPERWSLKVSLSILNTSTSRVLAPHTVENAPKITDWLRGIWQKDRYLREECRLILLGEVAGAAWDGPVPAPLADRTYGAFSAIWRESLHRYLRPEEEAVPYNGLCQRDTDGTPLIDPWVRQLGVETWTRRLLEVSLPPILHLLYAHGIGMEAHAQNMVLIHRKGVPERIALKDFHDGIRFSADHLTDPGNRPDLTATPESHARINRNSFIETEDPRQVSDFMLDAFFFVNLGELAMFLQDVYGLAERRFWEMAREIVGGYMERFDCLTPRFRIFDLLAPRVEVEQLTKRRLFPETELRVHEVRNPLARVASGEGLVRVETE